MRPLVRCLLLVSLILLLVGCIPAGYLNLYNATDDALTVIKPHLRRVITIEPHTAVDVPLVYVPGEQITIRGDRHSWAYSPRSLFPPQWMYQQHIMVMRAFAKIDRRGEISMITPAGTRQPPGFPVKPQKT
jgi:hypothetical protein